MGLSHKSKSIGLRFGGVVVLAAIVAAATPVGAEESGTNWPWVVQRLSGTAAMHDAENDVWRALETGQVVPRGHRVCTSPGSAMELAGGHRSILVAGDAVLAVERIGGPLVALERGAALVRAPAGAGSLSVRVGAGAVSVDGRQALVTRLRGQAKAQVTLLGLDAACPPMDRSIYLLEDRPNRRMAVGYWVLPASQAREHESPRLTEHDVRVAIRNDVARVRVQETFVNRHRESVGGTFAFPLPRGASITRLALVDASGKATEARYGLRAEDAEPAVVKPGNPESLPSSGRVQTWRTPRLFQAAMPDVAAGGQQRVVVEYVQTLKSYFDRFTFQLPLTSAPGAVRAVDRLNVAVDLQADTPLADVVVASHPEARVQRLNPGQVQTSLRGSDWIGRRDLVLTWRLPERPAVVAEAYRAEGGTQGGVFRLTVRPKLPAVVGRTAGRTIAIVYDTSAGLDGPAMQDQKHALQTVMASLRPADRVRLFAADQTCRPLWDGYVSADSRALQHGVARVGRTTPAGASDLADALGRAARDVAAQPSDGERHLVYLGDGRPTSGALVKSDLVQAINPHLAGGKVRLTALVFGRRKASGWLKELVRHSGGSLLWPGRLARCRQIVHLWALNANRPPIVSGRCTVDGMPTRAVAPAVQSPIFPGDSVTFYGWSEKPGPMMVDLRGQRNGEPERQRWRSALPEPSSAHVHVGLQWARLSMAQLLSDRQTPRVREASIKLSRQWQLPNPYMRLRWTGAGEAAPTPWPMEVLVAAVPQQMGRLPDLPTAVAPSGEPAEQKDLLDRAMVDVALRIGQMQNDIGQVLRRAHRLIRSDPEQAAMMLQTALDKIKASDLHDRPELEGLRRRVKLSLRYATAAQERLELKRLDELRRQAEQAELDRRRVADQLKQEQINTMLEKARTLMHQKQYGQAAEAAKRALAMDPDIGESAVTGLLAQQRQRIQRVQRFEQYKRTQHFEAMRDVWESGTLRPDEPPMSFPSAAFWGDITRRRGTESSSHLGTTTRREEEIQRQLTRPVSIDFDNAPLSDVVDFLRNFTGVNIVLDNRAMEDVGVTPDTTVTLKLNEVSLKSTLKLLLGQLELAYLIRNEVILITTSEKAGGDLVTRVYPVADLVIGVGNYGDLGEGFWGGDGTGTGTGRGTGGSGWGGGTSGSSFRGTGGGITGGGSVRFSPTPGGSGSAKTDFTQDLIDLIRKVIEPESWEPSGAGVIRAIGNGSALIITAPGTVQDAMSTAWRLAPTGDPGARLEVLAKLGSDLDLASALSARLAERGDTHGAIDVLEAGLSQAGGGPAHYLQLAQLYRLAKRPRQERLRLLTSLLEAGPKSAAAHHALGWQLELDGQPAEALAAYKKGVALEQGKPQEWLAIARVAARAADTKALNWAVLQGMAFPGEVAERIKRIHDHYRFHRVKDTVGTDLVVTVRWDSDADVDLIVTEPDGSECSCASMATPGGGWLSGDSTDGSGSETYSRVRAAKGKYRIQVGCRRAADKPTTVTVDVWRWKGSTRQKHETFAVKVHRPGQVKDVIAITMPAAR